MGGKSSREVLYEKQHACNPHGIYSQKIAATATQIPVTLTNATALNAVHKATRVRDVPTSHRIIRESHKKVHVL